MQLHVTDFFKEVAANKIIWASFLSWIIAQGIKIVSGIIQEKRFDFAWLIGTGGMPSAHSAGVAALAAAVGLATGFASIPFAVAVIFALVTMFDAQGVRRMAGLQAEALNRLMEDIYFNREVKQERLRELLGHTPIEVFMGAVLGTLIALIVMTC